MNPVPLKSRSLRVNVTTELHEKLTAHAEREDLPMAYVIRQALREYLAKQVSA